MDKKLLTKNQVSRIDGGIQLLNENTKISYSKSIDDFLDYYQISLEEIGAISGKHLIGYKNHLKKKYKSSTVNTKLKAIRKLFKITHMVVPGFNDPFLFVDVYINLDKKKIITVLQNHEINKLLKYVQVNRPKMYALFKLLCFSGIRISEALAVKESDIKTRRVGNKKQYYLVIHGKGAKERQVPLTYQLVKDLQGHTKKFPVKSGCSIFHYDRSYISKSVKGFCKKLFERNDIAVHTLRHTFATQYFKKYPNKILELSEMLGHSSYRTTKNMYIHVIRDEIKREELNNLYS